MTEAEWLACTDPAPMLEFLRGKASERKMRLFVVTCCRRIWDLLDERARRAVETAERDDPSGPTELAVWAVAEIEERLQHQSASRPLVVELPPWWGVKMALLSAQMEPIRRLVARIAVCQQGQANDTQAALRATPGDEVRAARAAWATAQEAKADEQAFQSNLIREIFGNPFRPLSTIDAAWLAWNGGAVRKMAEAVYDERRFADLPVLADALEDAGCTDAELLAHLRERGPHVRGCHALDAILGKG